MLRSEMRAKNLWHRASYVFIQDIKDTGTNKNKFLIQKRTTTKDYCPGYYDLATGGVVSAGEDDDISAAREVEEELGIKDQKLVRLSTLRFSDDASRVFGNLYFLKMEIKMEDLVLQPSEVEDVEFWSVEEIKANIKNPAIKITPDSIEAFKYMLENNHFV